MASRRPRHPFHDISESIGKLANEITRGHFAHFYQPNAWKPNLNAYHCGDRIEICVDLAGVDRSAIKLTVEGRFLRVRGSRATPEPAIGGPCYQHILTMEIENGPFERTLELPAEVDAAAITARQENGLLWILLPLTREQPVTQP